MAFADQSSFDVRFEWGLNGLRAAADDAIVVLIDILSFTTSVTVACCRGAVVFPCQWNDTEAAELAARVNARLAMRRGGDFSLSPESLLAATPELRLVLPSQNGSVLAHEGMKENRRVVAASIRNAAAVAAWLSRQRSAVSVIAAGERWPDGTLRVGVEDLVGAGAVIARLEGARSPEAESAVAAYENARANLLETLRNCASGRELVKRGYDADVALAAEQDVDNAVPILVDGAFRSAA